MKPDEHSMLGRLIKNADNVDKEVYDEIMELVNNHSQECDHLIMAMIAKLLDSAHKHGVEKGINLINNDEKHILQQELKAIIDKLRAEGINVNEQDIMQKIIAMLYEKFMQDYEYKPFEKEPVKLKHKKKIMEKAQEEILRVIFHQVFMIIHEGNLNNNVIAMAQKRMIESSKTVMQQIADKFQKDAYKYQTENKALRFEEAKTMMERTPKKHESHIDIVKDKNDTPNLSR